MASKRAKTLPMPDPTKTAREEAAALLRAKHYLLGEQAKIVVTRRKRRQSDQAHSRSIRGRRDRRLVKTGETSVETPWRDPTMTHPDAPLDDGFGLEISERQQRAYNRRRQRKTRGAYWELIGPPPTCLPGDQISAAIFHRRVVQAQERGGWTHHEQTALAFLERKWRKRARGEDARFIVAGNRAGRLPRIIEAKVERLRSRED